MKKAILLAIMLLIPGCSSTEAHFCPGEDCKSIVLKELKSADDSIYFMLYSFTDDDISHLLVEKYNKGVDVKGVIESQGLNRETSEYDYLINNSIKIKKDRNRYLMHNKVFIIDKKAVITGSANPSKNGYERNNDNIVVIKDKNIAERYLEEFDNIYR